MTLFYFPDPWELVSQSHKMINTIFHTFLKGKFVMYVVIKFSNERPPPPWTGTSGVWNGAKREAEENYERNGGRMFWFR